MGRGKLQALPEREKIHWGRAILVDSLTKRVSSYESQSIKKSKMSRVCYTSVTCSKAAWC